MDEDKLRQLIKIFTESALEELEIHHSFWRGTRIKLSRRRHPPAAPKVDTAPAAPPESGSQTEGSPASPAPSGTPETPASPTAGEREEGLHTIYSPMVGTFFRSPSPEEDPFVREGDQVELGQTLCIIEAMKIMNEIEAEVEGEIVEILVDTGEPVEYNQPLLRIRPA